MSPATVTSAAAPFTRSRSRPTSTRSPAPCPSQSAWAPPTQLSVSQASAGQAPPRSTRSCSIRSTVPCSGQNSGIQLECAPRLSPGYSPESQIAATTADSCSPVSTLR
ncbi:unnamed protein product [Heterosigma akashiwo]